MNIAQRIFKSSNDEKQHICETCGKIVKFRSALIIHNRILSVEKPFICDTCDKSFGRKDVLEIHQLTHSGLEIYQFDVFHKEVI